MYNIWVRTNSTTQTTPPTTHPESECTNPGRSRRTSSERGSSRSATTAGGGFYSTIFQVPKKDGGQRPVINLKVLNKCVSAPHFKMEGIHTLKHLRTGDWLAKVDLKDVYFSILIHPDHRKFLCFPLGDKVYQFTCLPFGLASEPWVFTKTLRPVAALAWELGMRVIFYIYEILLDGVQGEFERPGISTGLSVTVSRVHHKQEEDSLGTNTIPSVPGFYSRPDQKGAQSIPRETQKDQSRSSKTSRGRACLSSISSKTPRENECDYRSHSPQHPCSTATFRWI